MTAFVLGLPEHKVRVIAPDVGGGFGSKIYLYAGRDGDGLGVEARQPARSSGRAERSECLPVRRARPRPCDARRTGAGQGRQVPRACACTPPPAWAPTCRRSRPAFRRSFTRRCSPASTRRRRSTAKSTAAFTNTAPVDAYRGAGRPEATYVVERLVHAAAVEMGIAQDEIRRRNFIRTFPVPDAGCLAVRHRWLRRVPRRGDEDGRRRRVSRAQGRRGQARQAARHWVIRLTSKPAVSRRPISPARWALAPVCSKPAKCASIRPAA